VSTLGRQPNYMTRAYVSLPSLRAVAATVAAGFALLAPRPVPAQAGDATLADSLRAVLRLPPAAFPQLPRAVRRALVARGCTIPQSAWAAGPHNVVSGRFTGAARRDWAVLCARRHSSYILVFHGGSPRRVDSLAHAPLTRSLVAAGPGRWVYERHLTRATPADIHEMAAAYDDPLPRCLDHDGLNDAPSDKSSELWYRLGARWRDLLGHALLSEEDRAVYTAPCSPTSR
jgi:hypothetical protein